MTCLSLLRSSARDDAPAGTAAPVVPAAPVIAGPRRACPLRRLAGRLRQEDAPTQFVRFALVGGTSSLVYATIFVSLLGWGPQRANIIGAVVSTVLANELHRRLTFHAGGRVAWLTAQLEGGSLTLAGMTATSLALAALAAWTEQVGAPVQLLVIGTVTGAVGLVRFAALRWLFRPRVLPAGADASAGLSAA